MALTRITKGVIKPNENYDTHNINSTGIVTAVGANFTGNVSVGGSLTYEDVTSIDSVGLITARNGIDCNGDLDVDGHTNLDNVSVAGVSTFQGNVRIGDNSSYSAGTGSDDLVIGETTGQHGMTILTGNNSSSINFADSASANPGAITYNHNGDNYMRFRVAGDERVRITSAGKVGIGSDAPTLGLDINKAANSGVFLGNPTHGYKLRANVTGSNDYGILIEDEDGVDLYRAVSSTGTSNADTHTFYTAGSERLRIASDGKVGINEDSPTRALSIDGDMNLSSGSKIESYSSGGNLQIQGGSTYPGGHIKMYGGSGDDMITFNTSGASVSSLERLRIKSDGKIGINDINPQTTLHIKQAADNNTDGIRLSRVNSAASYSQYIDTSAKLNIGYANPSTADPDPQITLDQNGNVGIGSQSPQATLDVYGDNTSAGGLIQITQDGAGDAAIDFQLKGTREYSLGIDNSDSDKFKLSGSAGLANNTLLTVTNGGNIGINSTSPSSPLEIYTAASAAWKFRIDTTVSDGAGFYQRSNGDFELVLRDASNNNNYIAGSGGELQFTTSGTEKLRITSSGRVNIAPNNLNQTAYKVQIETGANRFLSIKTANHNDFSDEGSGIFFSRQSDGSKELSGIFAHTNTSLGMASRANLTFHAGGSGGYSQSPERLRITNQGLVGIGTDSPDSDAYIHIVGQDNGKIILEDNSNNGANLRKNYIGIVNSDNLVLAADEDNLGSSSSIRFRIDNNEKVRIVSNGRVGIGTDSPQEELTIMSSTPALMLRDSDQPNSYTQVSNANQDMYFSANGASAHANFIFRSGNNGSFVERLRIDSSGRLLIGTNNSRDNDVYLQLEGVGYQSSTMQITRNSNNADGGGLYIVKTRGTADGQSTIVQNGDELGYINFRGADGTDGNTNAATIQAFCDGAPGSNDMPGRLVFSTTADGASSATERLRISSTGRLLFGNHLNDRGAELQYEGSEHAGIGIHRNTNSHGAPALQFSASRGTSAGSNTIVQSGDYLGMISFKGTDGSDLANGAFITAIVDGTPGNNDMPGRLGFWTSPDGSQTPVERLRIASDGATKVCHNGGAFGVGGDPINKFGITSTGNNFFGLHRSNATTGTGEFNINVESNSQVTFAVDDEGAFSFGTSTDPSAQSSYSEKVRITNAGQVKIPISGKLTVGHTNPAARFTVGPTNGSTNIEIEEYGVIRGYNRNSSAWSKIDFEAAYYVFDTDGTEKVRIASGGKVTMTTTQNNQRGLAVIAPKTQINFGTTADKGGFLMSEANGQFGLSGGAYWTGSNWQAVHTGSAQIRHDGGAEMVFCTNSGLTVGSHFTPSSKFRITSSIVQLEQDIRLEAKPNSTWNAGLYIGGNGNGSSSTHGSMVVTNGNLHLDARDGTYGVYLNWYGGNRGTYFGNGSGTQKGRIDGSGNLSLSGNYPGSDLRLKENIQNIGGALDTIKSLSGKTFTWKKEAGLDDWKHYGFIAQEVQKVVPDLVKDIGCHYFDKDDKLVNEIDPTESDEDRKNKGLTQSLTVNNEGVTPILVEAMKELITKIETLESKVATLEGS